MGATEACKRIWVATAVAVGVAALTFVLGWLAEPLRELDVGLLQAVAGRRRRRGGGRLLRLRLRRLRVIGTVSLLA